MNEMETIIARMQKAKRILFVTGAGISQESGIPTYHGVGGLYNTGTLIEGQTIEEIMSEKTIRENPGLVWKCLKEKSAFCHDIHPNKAHRVVAEMEKHFQHVVTLTQNVDGLHRKAGSQKVIDIHGDIHNLHCANCSHNLHVENIAKIELPPFCQCGHIMRPEVIFFGENLPNDKMMLLAQEISVGFDIVFIIGTSGRFPYVFGPIVTLHNQGSLTIEINIEHTDISDTVHHKITGKAGECLGEIWKNYQDSVSHPFF